MKTMIKKFGLAISIALFTSATLFAFEDSLKVNDGTSVDLVINDVRSQTLITFKDKRNNILFEQHIENSEEFAKTFSLELLPDGDYRFEINSDTRTKIMPVSIDANGVQVCESEVRELYKPVVYEKGTLVYVNQFSPDRKPLYVAIFNDNNEVIHEDWLKGKMELGKIFDFSESKPGHYRIYLESNGSGSDHLVYVEE